VLLLGWRYHRLSEQEIYLSGCLDSRGQLCTLVDDTLPAGLTLTAPWTCVASAGGSCPASGGAIGGSAVNLTGTVAGASGTLTITVPVAFSANPNDY